MAGTGTELLSSKIKRAIENSGMTKKDIAAAIGVTKQSITGWEDSGRISKPNLQKLAELLKIDINWFMTDKPSQGDDNYGKLRLIPSEQQRFDSNVAPANVGKRAIPVISAIQAGALKEITEPYELGAGYATLYTDDDYSKWAFGLEIEGDSMLPEFKPGDMVIIEPDWEPRPGEYVAAKNGQEEATFKKYRPRGVDSNGTIIFELTPLNDDYPTLRSDITQLKIIGVMAEHRRKSRRR
ncbi:MAG: helix-turn-helix domain-containing protein [Burkholderiaceae bacterium]|nr:helix-turn-helix domain-containing protein [Burkholderiaceae bacterium]